MIKNILLWIISGVVGIGLGTAIGHALFHVCK